jgi:hypothetical protein
VKYYLYKFIQPHPKGPVYQRQSRRGFLNKSEGYSFIKKLSPRLDQIDPAYKHRLVQFQLDGPAPKYLQIEV